MKFSQKSLNRKSFSLKRGNAFNSFGNNFKNDKSIFSKRYSFDLKKTKSKHLLEKYNLKNNNDSLKKNLRKGISHVTNRTSLLGFNTIEKNIKNYLNNMRLDFEKKAKVTQLELSISPKNKKGNLTPRRNLIVLKKIKKIKNNILNKSYVNHEFCPIDINNSVKD